MDVQTDEESHRLPPAVTAYFDALDAAGRAAALAAPWVARLRGEAAGWRPAAEVGGESYSYWAPWEGPRNITLSKVRGVARRGTWKPSP